MPTAKYQIDEINVGDEVYFDSTSSQGNFDEYWKVIGKSRTELMIEINYLGNRVNWTIDIKEVRQFIKLTPS
jgi:hypothetical protein